MSIKQPVVVTGADGLLGKHIVNRLLRENIKVRPLLMAGQKPDAEWLSSSLVEVFYGDVSKKETLIELMKGAGTICHNAAIVTDWAPKKLYDDVNVEGTRNLLELAVESNTRFILTSSVTVYGDNLEKIACDETTPFGNYSRTKQIQEVLALQYFKEHGLPVTIIRPGNIIGRGSKPWVHDLLEQMSHGLPTIIGDGNVRFALCHVENLVQVFYLVMKNHKSICQIYNGWDDLSTITWKTYVTDLAKIAGYTNPKRLPLAIAKLAAYAGESIWQLLKIKHRPPVTFQVLNQVASPMQLSNQKIKTDLGYTDIVTYNQAMNQLADYIQEKKLYKK